MGKKTPEIVPFPLGFLHLAGRGPRQHAKNLVKIARMVREMCSRSDRHTHTHTHTDVFITILRHRFRGEVNTYRVYTIQEQCIQTYIRAPVFYVFSTPPLKLRPYGGIEICVLLLLIYSTIILIYTYTKLL